MKSLTNIFVATLGVTNGLANAQGLVTNCTWQTGFMSGSFLGMYCNNNNWAEYSYDWTWLDTNLCLTNYGGKLYPYVSGSYWSTCGNCAVRGSNVNYMLTCDCLNADGHFASSNYDLNRVVWNHDGILGCFNHIGNKTEKGPF